MPTPPSLQLLPPVLHSLVACPCGTVDVMTPGWAGTAPLGSSIRALFTSGSLEEAAAVSSVPGSQTRLTTTGVDELAWAARSCSGFVRAGKEEKREKQNQWGEAEQVFAIPRKARKQNPTVKRDSWHAVKCCFPVHFDSLACLVLPSPSTTSAYQVYQSSNNPSHRRTSFFPYTVKQGIAN